MTAAGFDGTPFVAGSLFGLRSFSVDSLGRLTGVVHKSVWRPGVNEAECFAAVRPEPDPPVVIAPEPEAHPTATSLVDRVLGRNLTTPSSPARAQGGLVTSTPRSSLDYYNFMLPSYSFLVGGEPTYRPDDHREAMVGCACGFYAYFNGTNKFSDYDGSHTISGIVEGYGMCTVGSQGFRASKARIVALVIDDPTTPEELIRHEALRRNYPDVPTVSTELEAVRCFPLTRPDDVPSPSTDPDFWTRSAS